ncbi:hypothetical protein [Mesorhizobium sp.]|uniref:hypothetical protein n=1 Tax=Mesorhizobium sp. TaxID=1871066 RepID=UPI00257EAFBB|nr:hypothetical protein [Mesorhizobium sp.]
MIDMHCAGLTFRLARNARSAPASRLFTSAGSTYLSPATASVAAYAVAAIFSGRSAAGLGRDTKRVPVLGKSDA